MHQFLPLKALPYQLPEAQEVLEQVEAALLVALEERDQTLRYLTRWVLRLFGGSLYGVMEPLVQRSGQANENDPGLLPTSPALTALARQIILEYARQQAIGVPLALLAHLNSLEKALLSLAQSDFPFLLGRAEISKEHFLLVFYRETAPTSFGQYLAAQAHLKLASRSHHLFEDSLQSLLTVYRRLARRHSYSGSSSTRLFVSSSNSKKKQKSEAHFPNLALIPTGFDCQSLSAAIGTNRETRRTSLDEVENYFRGLDNRQGWGRELASSTLKTYRSVVSSLLEPMPYASVNGSNEQDAGKEEAFQAGTDQRQRHARQYFGPRLFTDEAANVLETDLEEDAAEEEEGEGEEDTPAVVQAYLQAAQDDADLDAGLLAFLDSGSGEAEILQASEAEISRALRGEPQLEGLPRSQIGPRLNYLRDWVVLARHVTTQDASSIPLWVLGLGYAVLTGGAGDRLSDLAYSRLSHRQLLALALYHLALTTGRQLDTILAITIGSHAEAVRPAPDFYPPPFYDPIEGRLWAVPKVYPGWTERLTPAETSSTLLQVSNLEANTEEGVSASALAPKVMSKAYHSVELWREVVLDETGRYLLRQLYYRLPFSRRKPGTVLFSLAEADGSFSIQPLGHNQALDLVPGLLNETLQGYFPGSSQRVSFSRLRHTFWTQLVTGGDRPTQHQHEGSERFEPGRGVHPLLVHIEADLCRMELRAPLFYACVSNQLLEQEIGSGQHRLLARIGQAYAAIRLHNPALPLLPVFNLSKYTGTGQKASAETRSASSPSSSSPTPRSTLYYGARYCPRPEVVRLVTAGMLGAVASRAALYKDDPEASARVRHNALVMLCAYLTALTLGTRSQELTDLRLASLDLSYRPALVTLVGKGNGSYEESRTLALLPELVPLWERVLVPVRTTIAPGPGTNLIEVAALQIYSQPRQPHKGLQPLRPAHLRRYLREIGAKGAGLSGGGVEGTDLEIFKFHSLRHFLFSFFLLARLPQATAAYWLGHQTSGAELLHPLTGSSLQESWATATAACHNLLAQLGLTPEILQTVLDPASSLYNEGANEPFVFYSSAQPPGLAQAESRLPLPKAVDNLYQPTHSHSASASRAYSNLRQEQALNQGSPRPLTTLANLTRAKPNRAGQFLAHPGLEKTLTELEKGSVYSQLRSVRAVREGLIAAQPQLVVEGSGKLVGLPATFLQKIYEQICHPDRHRSLGRSQRRHYVRVFNRIGESLQPFITTELTPVQNYRQIPRPLPVSAKANLVLSPSAYERLLATLEEDILSHTHVNAQRWWERLALLLVLRLGVTFEGSLAGLGRVRLGDVDGELGWVKITLAPKGQRWLRVWLDDLSAVSLGALIQHRLRREPGVNRRQLVPLPAGQELYLATGRATAPTPAHLSRLRVSLNTYLCELANRVGLVPLSLDELLPVARWHLLARQIYPGAVISMLAGKLPTSVLPPARTGADNVELRRAWLNPLDYKLPPMPLASSRTEGHLGGHKDPQKGEGEPGPERKLYNSSYNKKQLPSPSRSSSLSVSHQNENENENKDANDTLLAARLSKLSGMITELERGKTRRQVEQSLLDLACQWAEVSRAADLGPALQDLLSAVRNHQAEDKQAENSTTTLLSQVRRFNLVALAAWLAKVVREQRPRTALTYKCDGAAIVRLFPDLPVCDLGLEEIEVILELDTIGGPRVRRRSALTSWRSFLGYNLRLPLASLNLRKFHQPSRTVEEDLLTPTELTRLLEELARQSRPTATATPTATARMAYIAAPLCYYGMLRIGEVIRLELRDLELYSHPPYLQVRNSKRGKSRRVNLGDVPLEVVDWLRGVEASRLWEEGTRKPEASLAELKKNRLLEGAKGQALSESLLSRTLSGALRAIGREQCTAHTLRKSGANWRYLGGTDIRHITRALGHAGPGVTFLSYIRTLDLLQRAGLEKLNTSTSNHPVSGPKLAGLLNVSERMGQLHAARLRAKDRSLTLACTREILIGELRPVL